MRPQGMATAQLEGGAWGGGMVHEGVCHVGVRGGDSMWPQGMAWGVDPGCGMGHTGGHGTWGAARLACGGGDVWLQGVVQGAGMAKGALATYGHMARGAAPGWVAHSQGVWREEQPWWGEHPPAAWHGTRPWSVA